MTQQNKQFTQKYWDSKNGKWLYSNNYDDFAKMTGAAAPTEKKFFHGDIGVDFADYGNRYRRRTESYAAYAQHAYAYNAVAYRCVNVIASAAANIKFKLMIGETAAPKTHPLLRTLNRPNNFENRISFFHKLFGQLLISGNAFILKTEAGDGTNKRPAVLELLRPDRMDIKINKATGKPEKYVYKKSRNKKEEFAANPVTGESRIKHIMLWDPMQDWKGMSPLSAAWLEVHQYNNIVTHNLSQLENGTRIFGALKYNPTDETGETTDVNDEQFDAMMHEIKAKFEGSRNAGKMPILTGDWSYLPFGMTPRDMDFKEFIKTAGRDIALALGVPAQLIGIPDSQTYNNFAEARLSLYTDTIIPLCDQVLSDLQEFCIPEELRDRAFLEYDYNACAAMAENRRQIIDNNIKLLDRGVINHNEFREKLEMEPITGGEVYFVGQNMFPLEDAGTPPAESETPDADSKEAYGQ